MLFRRIAMPAALVAAGAALLASQHEEMTMTLVVKKR